MIPLIILSAGFLICAVIDIALDRINDKIQRERFFSQYDRKEG